MEYEAEIDLSQVTGFEWDDGNKEKNNIKHQVANSECEEIFSNNPVFLPDRSHSQYEERYFAFGITQKGRFLLLVFTLRGKKKDVIRVISARDMDKKEKSYYITHREVIET